MSQSTVSVEKGSKSGRVTRILRPNEPFKFESLSFPAPERSNVRLKIEACGVCHSDSFSVSGLFPGLCYPLTPGHEIVGIIDAVGPDVNRLRVGDRVGVGWYAGHCGECSSCRSGDFVTCVKMQTPGITCNGGYSEYAIFSEAACAVVPEAMTSVEAAPLLCAGITTFNALRHAGAKAGDTIAVLGIGGLGHLAIQFANKMGFKTVAIARGDDKEKFAKELGAHTYINSENPDAVSLLSKAGGAKVILATVTASDAMSPWVEALSVDGRLVIVGAGIEPLKISPVQLLMARRSIVGWPSGTAKDSEECMQFASLTGIKAMIEKYPFEKAAEAYDRMMSGKARFRVVL